MKRKLFFVFLIVQTVFTIVSANASELPSGKILYIDSNAPGENYLTIINPDGSGKKRITPAFNNIMFPKHNEKSGWIGFTNKTQNMSSEIYLLNKSGDRLKKAITGAAFEDFSPDGKFFLYTSSDNRSSLYIYSIENRHAIKVSEDLRITSAKWSDDGAWIAASALTEDGTSDLYLISTLAQGIKRITATEKVNESFPVFSRDGKFLAYFTDRHGDNEIEYLAIDQSEIQRPLVRGLYPSLSPDNRWMVFQTGNTVSISSIEGLDVKTVTKGTTPIWIK